MRGSRGSGAARSPEGIRVPQRDAGRRVDRHRGSALRRRSRPLLQEASERVEHASSVPATGNITNGERYNKVIDTWTHAQHRRRRRHGERCASRRAASIRVLMYDSGSRGSRDQIRQLAGMRGLMAGKTENSPVVSVKSSKTRSSRTSAKACRCSSTSRRRTAPARVWPIRRSRRPTPDT